MDLNEKLNKVSILKHQIDAYGKLPDNLLNKINYKFRLDWNYYSNSMEGNTLTKSETRSIMIGNVTLDGKPIRDVLEMKGHDDVIQQILRIGKGEMNISERRIKDLHKAIMKEEDPERKKEVGEWKKRENEIINYKDEKFEFSKPSAVPYEMHTLINWLNAEGDKIKKGSIDSLHPAIIAFEFHLRYLTIHPFYDGNGRTARILMNLILISYGYPPVIIKTEEKKIYYQYLADVQCYDAPKDFYLNFMLGLLIRSLELVKNTIDGKEIEEEDDIDKEIALIKANLKNHEQVSEKRSVDVIHRVVKNIIIPFVLDLKKEVAQFNELFNEGNILFRITKGSGLNDFHFYKPGYIEIPEDNLYSYINENKPEKQHHYQIECVLLWNGFKYNKLKLHQAHISFSIYFDEYNYVLNKVAQGNKQLPEIIKLYTEELTEEERKLFVKAVKKQILEQVKRLSA